MTESGAFERAWMRRVRGCECGFFSKDGSKTDAHFKGVALAVVFLHLSRRVHAADIFAEGWGVAMYRRMEGQAPIIRRYKAVVILVMM